MKISVWFFLIFIGTGFLYSQTNLSVNRNRFREIYERIYMEYYVLEKYEDALSVLLRLNPQKLDDSSKVDLYLLLGRVYVNLHEEPKAKNVFTDALKINRSYVPPAGEWLPTEEQVFFDAKEEYLANLKATIRTEETNFFPNAVRTIRKNAGKLAVGSVAVVGSLFLLSKKKSSSAQPLPAPPDFPNK